MDGTRYAVHMYIQEPTLLTRVCICACASCKNIHKRQPHQRRMDNKHLVYSGSKHMTGQRKMKERSPQLILPIYFLWIFLVFILLIAYLPTFLSSASTLLRKPLTISPKRLIFRNSVSSSSHWRRISLSVSISSVARSTTRLERLWVAWVEARVCSLSCGWDGLYVYK